MRAPLVLAAILVFGLSAPAQLQFDGLVNLPPDTDSTQAVALGDVDGDGDLDLVLGNDNGQDRLYLNDGSGTFTLTILYLNLILVLLSISLLYLCGMFFIGVTIYLLVRRQLFLVGLPICFVIDFLFFFVHKLIYLCSLNNISP